MVFQKGYKLTEEREVDHIFCKLKINWRSTMKEERFICCLCKAHCLGYGNNLAPLKEKGICCDYCNLNKVIPARMQEVKK